MKLVFVDESSDAHNTDYLGVCAALIDSSKYGELKREYLSKITRFGWDKSIEFKGTMIFSQSQGCPSVTVEQRIELTKEIIAMNTSASNSRIRFCYASSTGGSTNESYLRLVSVAVSSVLGTSTTTKGGKDVVSICFDQRSDVNATGLRMRIEPILQRKRLILFEDVILSRSGTETIGLCYADIVAYLMSRKDNIEVNHGRIEDLDPVATRTNGQMRKLLASTEIVGMIRSIRMIPVIGTIDVDTNGRIQPNARSRDQLAGRGR
ncbi:MAG TPA: DUF3800 domain-containing protein [Bacteroidota bacterium]|nr:DUF3800 domain-containing protein [Bacteroidota bacterium]